MKTTETPNERTLRDLVDDRLALFFECASCQRLSQSDILELVWRFGPDTKIETVRFKVVCSRCNARRATPLLKSVPTRRFRVVPTAAACQQVRQVRCRRMRQPYLGFAASNHAVMFLICSERADEVTRD